jgi:hypothetical protein
MLLQVTSVEPLNDFRLRVAFNDGSVKEVDLASEMYGEVFEPLKQPEFFRRVSVNPETNTIEWPNGADFAPEFPHRIGTEVRQIA